MPRKRTVNRQFNNTLFISRTAQTLHEEVTIRRRVIVERGLAPTFNIPQILEQIANRGWNNFVQPPGIANATLLRELYANAPDVVNERFYVRRTWIQINAERLNLMFGIPEVEDGFTPLLARLDADFLQELLNVVCIPGTVWIQQTRESSLMVYQANLKPFVKPLFQLISAKILPSSHLTEVTRDRIIFIYAFLSGIPINLGAVLFTAFSRCARIKRAGLIFPSLLTRLCMEANVIIEPDEEMVRPLALISSRGIAADAPPQEPIPPPAGIRQHGRPAPAAPDLHSLHQMVQQQGQQLHSLAEDFQTFRSWSADCFHVLDQQHRLDAAFRHQPMDDYPSMPPPPRYHDDDEQQEDMD